MNIAVYCSSRQGLSSDIEATALALGKWIGQNGHTLVYGGVNAGLMHTVAQASHDAGAHVVGVVPEYFMHRLDEVVDEVIETRDLNDRKDEMYRRSDAFVVLPGGIGTIDEWIATLSQITVDGSSRRIVVMNLDGMYDHMVEQLNVTEESPYARVKGMVDISIIASTINEMIESLEEIEQM